MEQVIAVTEQEETEQEKRFELLRQAAVRNDMTEEEAMALAEEARKWAYEQLNFRPEAKAIGLKEQSPTG